MALARVAFFIVVFAALSFGCKAKPEKRNPMAGGEINYAVNGISRGKVIYAPGVREEDASVVGTWLRDKGWFLTREDNRSALTGKARGTYLQRNEKVAANTRSPEPLAKVAPRGAGLEVIVYTDASFADSTDASEFAGDSAEELYKRLRHPVRFVVRGEVDKGKSVEWQDIYFDAPEVADARSNGK